MSKIDDADFRGMPQEVIDWKDKVTEIINFGKSQWQVVSTPPTWRARRGEHALVIATSGTLMVCTTDNTNTWRSIASFAL